MTESDHQTSAQRLLAEGPEAILAAARDRAVRLDHDDTTDWYPLCHRARARAWEAIEKKDMAAALAWTRASLAAARRAGDDDDYFRMPRALQSFAMAEHLQRAWLISTFGAHPEISELLDPLAFESWLAESAKALGEQILGLTDLRERLSIIREFREKVPFNAKTLAMADDLSSKIEALTNSA